MQRNPGLLAVRAAGEWISQQSIYPALQAQIANFFFATRRHLLLLVAEAVKASDQTMVFSYIVAATRPIGKAGPIGIILLVLTPFIEYVTGVSIREPFLSTFGITI